MSINNLRISQGKISSSGRHCNRMTISAWPKPCSPFVEKYQHFSEESLIKKIGTTVKVSYSQKKKSGFNGIVHYLQVISLTFTSKFAFRIKVNRLGPPSTRSKVIFWRDGCSSTRGSKWINTQFSSTCQPTTPKKTIAYEKDCPILLS